MADLPFEAVPTGDGTLRITAYAEDSPVPVELDVDAASAPAFRDALDRALELHLRGQSGGPFGPVVIGDAQVEVSATPGGVRFTVLR